MSGERGAPLPVSATYTPTQPYRFGYTRFLKQPDFGASAGNCFQMEESIASILSETLDLGNGKRGIVARPVYLIDPCQGQVASPQNPLKTATLVPNGNTFATGNFPSSITYLMEAITRYSLVPDGTNAGTQNYLLNQEFNQYQNIVTSASNTAVTISIAAGSLHEILGIHMATSAGTATVTVSVSTDNVAFLQVDSIAAAAATDLQYTLATNALNGVAQAGSVAGTGISTVKLNPLAFRIIKIVIGTAGVGNTTTTQIAMR